MYKSFVIHQPAFGFVDNKLEVQCSYSFDGDRNFVENFSFDFGKIEEIYIDDIPRYVDLVAIAAAPSYFKAAPTNQLTIDFPISSQVLEWTTALFDEGLREFRFQNELNLLKLPIIIAHESSATKGQENQQDKNLVLAPIGGGKDSATTLEILKRTNKNVVGFAIGDFEPIKATAKAAGITLVKVTRRLDPTLLEWNKSGALNGHVPVTALTSTLACLAAYCIGAGSVAMSNEASANEATRVVDGIDVNHQFSKSFLAEKYLRKALYAHVGTPINYFSLLRELSEYEIFSIFSMATDFHKSFTSCNRAFKIDKKDRSKSWCGECDKCRFVFVGLAAFLDIKSVAKIFGKNLLEDETNAQGFLDLIGMGDGKPFECVGTVGETVLLMKKALNKLESNGELKKVVSEIKDIEFLSQNEKSVGFIDEEYETVIDQMKIDRYKQDVLSKLDGEKIGVVGLGRDTAGIITFLENIGYTQGINIFLPDDQDITDDEFLKANEDLQINDVGFARKLVRNQSDLNKCTIVFVSPGISKYGDVVTPLEERATTPLAWWLALNKELLPEKIFVGVTGTKGKSTTTSMLNHVLDDSVLVGNIGNSVGSLPLEELMQCRYVILEVSSFQASYITVSPHVGVLTSLFDCHIDWHLTSENYTHDKQNLFEHGCDAVLDYRFNPDERNEKESSNSLTLDEQNQNMILRILKVVAPSLTKEDIKEKLTTFTGLKYRKELVAIKNGLYFISDVLASAPHASVEAIIDTAKTYPKAKVFLLFGGANKKVDHSDVIKEFNQIKTPYTIVTLPETGHEIEEQLKNHQHCDELADGIEWVYKNANEGDIVLLAPGAQSFHRWKNYEKLHEHFIELIEKL